MIPARFVKSYRKSKKSDFIDAEATPALRDPQLR